MIPLYDILEKGKNYGDSEKISPVARVRRCKDEQAEHR